MQREAMEVFTFIYHIYIYISRKYLKELSLCLKLEFTNPYIQPDGVDFKYISNLNYLSNRIHS